MQAIGKYIVIKKEAEEVKKVGNFELDKNDREIGYATAKVISIGDEVRGLKEGDLIKFDKNRGHGIDIDSIMYHVITVGDVVVVL